MRYGLGFKADKVAAALVGDPILTGEVNHRVVIPSDYSSVISVCTVLEYLGAFQEAGLVYETVIGATNIPSFGHFYTICWDVCVWQRVKGNQPFRICATRSY